MHTNNYALCIMNYEFFGRKLFPLSLLLTRLAQRFIGLVKRLNITSDTHVMPITSKIIFQSITAKLKKLTP